MNMKSTIRPGGFRAALAIVLVVLLGGTSLGAVVIPDSLRHHPDYWRPVDPESMAVVLGRRPNAALVQMRFASGGPSMEGPGPPRGPAPRPPPFDSPCALSLAA